jgi:ArsR family transcriptional regulator
LTGGQQFDYSRDMEMTQALDALGALAHATRLQVYRLLVEAGPGGVPAGRIAEALGLPAATLSFHLAHLVRAGIAASRQEGRFVIYRADFRAMRALVGYLTENCCQGARNETTARARRCA